MHAYNLLLPSWLAIIEYADGVVGYKYYTTGWSRTKNGKPVAADDMIVSEGNADFWLVNNVPLECLFVVENAQGKFVPYYTENALITELKSNSGSKKVVLCSDIEMTVTSGIAINPNGKVLCLNNYTLSHNQNAHLFIFSESATKNFSICGPGTIERTGTHTVFTSGGGTTSKTNQNGIVVDGVTFKTASMIGDLRIGQHKFINCEFYQSNKMNSALFDLWNKNTTMTNGVPANLQTVTLNSCTIKRDITSNAVFSFTSTTYSEVYVNDTTIISASPLMKADSELVKIYVSGSSAISAPSLTSSTLAYQNIKFFEGVVTNLELDALNRAFNSVLANNYNVMFNYKVTTEYAEVNWLDLSGNLLCKEYVAVGETPKITNESVKSYLSTISNIYNYNPQTVVASGTINLKPSITLQRDNTLFHSINVSSDFALNIYILKSEFENNVKSVTVDGALLTASAYEVVKVQNSTYYRYSITAINPARAAEKHTVVIKYNDDSKKTLSLSPVTYLNDLIAASGNDNEKILALKMLNYFASAYVYTGKIESAEYSEIKSIVDAYSNYDVIFGGLHKIDNVSTSNLNHAIYSARLSLSASVKLRLTLNSGFTGKLTITHNDTINTYVVKNGVCDGKRYIDVTLPANELLSDVSVSDGTTTAIYGINAYYTALDTSDHALKTMLFCLGEYSKASINYLNN